MNTNKTEKIKKSCKFEKTKVMKTLKNKLKQLKAKTIWLYNSYIWNPWHFKQMKRKAIKLHKTTGKRYFVVPQTNTKCMVVDNNYIKHYNKIKGVKRININDLLRMAYYATPARGLTQ